MIGKLIIKAEIKSDYEQINQVNDLAFSRTNEAELVKILRNKSEFISQLSLVGKINNKIVGYSLLFPISNDILSLGPVAVIPDYQKKKIGSQLIEYGIKIARKLNYSIIVVIGHPEYYPRFGFKKASLFNITSNYDKVPNDAFMVLPLKLNLSKQFNGFKIVFPDEYHIAD